MGGTPPPLDASHGVHYLRRMTRPLALAWASLSLLLAAACSSSAVRSGQGLPDAGAGGAGTGGHAGTGGSVADAAPDVDKSASCAATFGSSLTAAFGRLDGTVLAVVPPGDNACAMPNSTHVVIQVTWAGEVYRMVLDVLSSVGNPDVFFSEIDAPLAAGPWAEGWHPGVVLDYVSTLGVHALSFTEMKEADLVQKVTSEIDLGSHVSIFATAGAGVTSSAHLIHRNATDADGAIVVRPESAMPHYLLFRFAEQTF